ncbi:hypothetical protein C8F04DRAFT_1181490 [Mycena alexandri]|uniref:Uncharacterized protein n=1 Tax=Mycena alexandri TaxID=1745969 RepID=A0AAD6SY54_9AGAR|nr:hypothetical protein C8F04DRAFT_1181490 [Mycena alexandri]
MWFKVGTERASRGGLHNPAIIGYTMENIEGWTWARDARPLLSIDQGPGIKAVVQPVPIAEKVFADHGHPVQPEDEIGGIDGRDFALQDGGEGSIGSGNRRPSKADPAKKEAEADVIKKKHSHKIPSKLETGV